MLSKINKPSKQEIIQSLQRSSDSHLSVFEPVTKETQKQTVDQITKIIQSSSFVSIVVIKTM